MSPWLLGVLVLVDGTLCGFRVAAGRNPRLFLREYYATSMRRGAVLAALILLAFVPAVFSLGDENFAAVRSSADSMVQIYGAYATIVVLALGLYGLGHFDLGVMATVLVLGPFTLLRPFVIIAGAAWAIWNSPHPAVITFAIASAGVMLAFERLLELGNPPWATRRSASR